MKYNNNYGYKYNFHSTVEWPRGGGGVCRKSYNLMEGWSKHKCSTIFEGCLFLCVCLLFCRTTCWTWRWRSRVLIPKTWRRRWSGSALFWTTCRPGSRACCPSTRPSRAGWRDASPNWRPGSHPPERCSQSRPPNPLHHQQSSRDRSNKVINVEIEGGLLSVRRSSRGSGPAPTPRPSHLPGLIWCLMQRKRKLEWAFYLMQVNKQLLSLTCTVWERIIHSFVRSFLAL